MVASLEHIDARTPGDGLASIGEVDAPHLDAPHLEPPHLESPRLDALVLGPGQVAGLDGQPGSGLTRLGLSLLVPHVAGGHVACLDVRGWLNPAAAWELGISPDRLVVVRCDDLVTWGRVMATLVSGLSGVYAEVPAGMRPGILRTVAARARTSRTPVVLRPLGGELPAGVAQLRLRSRSVSWSGVEAGHGHLRDRRIGIEASGRAVRGMQHTFEVEDHGTHDVRLVSGVGAPAARRLA